MARLFLVISYLLCTSFAFATDPYKISISKNEKVEQTFSLTVNNNSRLHLLMTKASKKKFTVKPVFVTENDQVIELGVLNYESLPSIISHHSNGDVVTVFGYFSKKKELHIIDIDTKADTQKVKTITDFESPYLIFRKDHESIFVEKDKKSETLTIKRITSGEDQVTVEVNVPEDRLKDFKALLKTTPSAINQNEFIEKGSIQEEKVYFEDDQLIFTKDNLKEATSSLAIIDLNNA
ncbi:MAG: hypothetical protein AAF901_11395, partial [Bacteroidota bacterium]